MHSLTHAGRNVVQAGLQSAAAVLGAVRDVGLQVGNAKLPLVHHANQAAAGLARALPCGGGQTDTAQAQTRSSPRDASVFNSSSMTYNQINTITLRAKFICSSLCIHEKQPVVKRGTFLRKIPRRNIFQPTWKNVLFFFSLFSCCFF